MPPPSPAAPAPPPPSSPQRTVTVAAAAAKAFTTALLVAAGVSPADARTTAHALVAADLRGTDTHGLTRLPAYLARLRRGAMSARAQPVLTQITPAVALLDGRNALGPVVATAAMAAAVAAARGQGVGVVGVRRSNHFGASAVYVLQAAEAGMASLVFTNSSAAMAAWGGRTRVLGVSPIAGGAPGGRGPGERVFVVDLAPSVAARGKVIKAARRGEEIPLEWGVGRDGRRTTDPKVVLDGGVMLPMGGPKGSAIALLMDVFAGVLSGSAFAGDVVGPYDSSAKEADVGHFFVAMRPDLFLEGGEEEFRRRMGHLYRTVVGSDRMEGVERIYFPGEIELMEAEKRMAEGIPYTQNEIEALNAEASRVGAPLLQTDGMKLQKAKL